MATRASHGVCVCVFGAWALTACSSLNTKLLGTKTYLTTREARGKVVPRSAEYGGVDFYVVGVEQLAKLRGASSLTYLGSDEQFHYLGVWVKVGREGEIGDVAVRVTECNVEDAATIDEELQYRPAHFSHHPWRHVELNGSACFVAGWSKEKYSGAQRLATP